MNSLYAVVLRQNNKGTLLKTLNRVIKKSCYLFNNHNVIDSPSSSVYFSTYSKVKNTPQHLTELQSQKESFLNNTSSVEVISHCRIDNKKQLLKKIVKEKATVKNNDDSYNFTNNGLLKALFSTYKNDLPKKLKGNFSYILWDDESEELHAAIDPFNSCSLFYLELNQVIYIASDAKVLASSPELNLTVNKRAIAQWLSGRPDPNISMYNEIKRLPNGHQLIWRDNTLIVSKFWDINSNNHIRYSTTEQYQQHFFDLLTQSVTNCLSSNIENNNEHTNSHISTPVFTQMSGGMDSTSITALANSISQKNNQTLHTLSHSYKNTNSCDEMNNINDMISTLGLANSHFIELDKFDVIGFSQLYPTDFDSPGIVLSPKYHEELSLMQSLNANVLLTGNGGDEVCWGHSSSYRSRLYKGEFGVINEVIKACGELNEPVASSLVKLFVKPLVPNTLQNLLRLALNKQRVNNTDNITSTWLTKNAVSLLEDNTIINPFNKTFEPAKFARYHSLKTTSTYNSMRSYQKVANEYGINVRHPFFDVDVVEFSFAIPEKMLIQGSYPKWLLRQTMKDYLPGSVVWNKHKVVFDHHFANLVRSNEKELRELLTHTGLQDLGLLDNNVLLREFDELVSNPNRHLNVDMLYAILTQSWYQTHCL